MLNRFSKILVVVLAICSALALVHWNAQSSMVLRPVGASTTVPGESITQHQETPEILRVLTANIRLPSSDDSQNTWVERRELLLRTLLAQDPDIIGMQEVGPGQTAYLLNNLKDFELVNRNEKPTTSNATTSSDKAGESGGEGNLFGMGLAPMDDLMGTLNQLYFRKDRFHLLEAQGGPLRPGVTQVSLSENTFYTLAVLEDTKKVFPTLLVVDTHLRHGEANAVLCAKKIHEILTKMQVKYPGAQMVVMGDMNHDRTSLVYQALEGKKTALTLRDTFDYPTRPKTETWGTYHAFSGKPAGEWPIDLIWVSAGLANFPATIVRDKDEVTGRFPSDHFFVKTTLKLPPVSTTKPAK